MKTKMIFSCLLIIMLISFNKLNVFANVADDKLYDVEITSDINNVQVKGLIESTITVLYNNQNLYNPNIKLSYHIFDDKNNLLIFENERIPLKLTEGKADIPISIDLNKNNNIDKYDKLIIRFDLVDEQNLYWYNDNNEINIKTTDIIISNDFSTRVKFIYSNLFTRQQPQFLISIVFLFLSIIALIIYKKNKLVTNSKEL